MLTAFLFGSAAPAAEPAEFSVATYNINWGNMDLRKMAATVDKADADLVLLQETTPPSEAWLRRQFRDRYPDIRFRGDKGQYHAERFGILSKSPGNRSQARDKHVFRPLTGRKTC
ncbi:MAG: endonuclease/exonuclease/phosphatase family protein, partial [Thermoguttaceae bacterium]|nr:endonuclease/exonuclease/phosphatase family protein [Thermoguttaceae bacterium]